MADITVIDTDILIDAGLGVENAVACLQSLDSTSIPCISIISSMEILVGCRNNAEMRKAKAFLSHFKELPLDSSISNIALRLLEQYRLSHGLLIADSLIAATALGHACPLISKNQRDFKYIKQLRLMPYN